MAGGPPLDASGSFCCASLSARPARRRLRNNDVICTQSHAGGNDKRGALP
jgi:hypothetical protein